MLVQGFALVRQCVSLPAQTLDQTACWSRLFLSQPRVSAKICISMAMCGLAGPNSRSNNLMVVRTHRPTKSLVRCSLDWLLLWWVKSSTNHLIGQVNSLGQQQNNAKMASALDQIFGRVILSPNKLINQTVHLARLVSSHTGLRLIKQARAPDLAWAWLNKVLLRMIKCYRRNQKSMTEEIFRPTTLLA